MQIEFKYNIGDSVVLTKGVPYTERTYFKKTKSEDVINSRVYEVNGFGWIDSGNGSEKFYRLNANADDYLAFDNKLSEDYLRAHGENNPHTIETVMCDCDGNEIHIGERVFSDILFNGVPVTDFTFSEYGTVVKMSHSVYVRNGDYLPTEEDRVITKREFLCKDENGKDYLDGRREGSVTDYSPLYINTSVPESYAKKYAIESLKRKHLDITKHPIKNWLDFMGVYDEVVKYREEYSKKKSVRKKNTSARKDTDPKKIKEKDKIEKLVENLSKTEIEELKKLLLTKK